MYSGETQQRANGWFQCWLMSSIGFQSGNHSNHTLPLGSPAWVSQLFHESSQICRPIETEITLPKFDFWACPSQSCIDQTDFLVGQSKSERIQVYARSKNSQRFPTKSPLAKGHHNYMKNNNRILFTSTISGNLSEENSLSTI